MDYLFWYLVGSFVIGTLMGVSSLNIWEKGLKKRNHLSTGGFWGYVLFPNTHVVGRVGYEPTFGITIIMLFSLSINSQRFEETGEFSKVEKTLYILMNIIFCLPRIVFNLLSFTSCHYKK